MCKFDFAGVMKSCQCNAKLFVGLSYFLVLLLL
jgi:hypothetical protein